MCTMHHNTFNVHHTRKQPLMCLVSLFGPSTSCLQSPSRQRRLGLHFLLLPRLTNRCYSSAPSNLGNLGSNTDIKPEVGPKVAYTPKHHFVFRYQITMNPVLKIMQSKVTASFHFTRVWEQCWASASM